MKLLYLANGYPPAQRAGTEVYTAGIASACARAGHDVDVVCTGDWATGPRAYNGITREQHGSVRVTRVHLNWAKGRDPNRSLYDNPRVEALLDDHLDQRLRPDVVHVTSCYTLSASVLRAVTRRRLPLVVTLTDFWFLCPRVTLLRSDLTLCSGATTAWECLDCLLQEGHGYRAAARMLPAAVRAPLFTWASRRPWFTRQRGLRGLALDMRERKATLPTLLESADVLIAPSQVLAGVYRAVGIRRPIEVRPYGHDLRWTKAVRPRPAKGPLACGFIGQIKASKGVHVLTAALSRLRATVPLTVDVWGDVEQEPAYVRSLPALGPAHPALRFRGRFTRAHLADVFNQIDVLVVPSLWSENTPLVVAEAFAAGRPVVASGVAGLAEAVTHGVDGMLFERGNARALAACLRHLAARRDVVERLRAGIRRVTTVEEEAAGLTELYRALRHRRSPERSSA